MLCYALGEKREQGTADGALRHGHPEVFRNGGPDDGEAVLIRQPASRHARRPGSRPVHRLPAQKQRAAVWDIPPYIRSPRSAARQPESNTPVFSNHSPHSFNRGYAEGTPGRRADLLYHRSRSLSKFLLPFISGWDMIRSELNGGGLLW